MHKIITLMAAATFLAGTAMAQVATDPTLPVPASSGTVVPATPPPAPQPAAPVPPPAAPVQQAPASAPPPAATVNTTTSTTYTTNTPSPTYNNRISKIRFGAFVSPNIAWMHPTSKTADQYDVKGNGSRVGFTYGLMAEYFFAPNYGLVSGLQVTSGGGKIISTNTDLAVSKDKVNSADFTYHTQYVELPVALKLRTDDINKFRFFGQLGLTLGANIGKKVDYTVKYYGDNTADGEQTATNSGVKLSGSLAMAPIMLSMNLGAGLEYPINNKLSIYGGLFFNNGFTPDATSPQEYVNSELKYKGDFKDGNTRLNNFSLRVGLFF